MIHTLNSYDISSESYIRKYTDKDLSQLTEPDQNVILDRVADDLLSLVRSGVIWFPFQKYFTDPPNELFNNIKQTRLATRKENYRLHSYYPKYGTFLPPRFRGEPIILEGTRDIYLKTDVLSDHFIEDIRLKAKRYDQFKSILECWGDDICLKEILKVALKKPRITPQILRSTLYQTIAETKIFNPTWARSLITLVMGPNVAGKKWLDISAGWGDRLITAMSLDMDYVGFDPNIELQPGHSQMIEMFGNPSRHKVIYEPFESGTIPPGPYDVIMTSPPYFNLEDYAPGQKGQSIVSFPTFNKWMVWFLFASLSKAWDNLKEGGYLILHLGDAKTIATSEATNIFIESYLPGASWEGVIGLQGDSGFPRPVWVWKKLPRTAKRNLWEPQNDKGLTFNKRTLLNTYPELQLELIKYFGNKYAPNYMKKLINLDRIRDHVEIKLPNISRDTINSILADDLLLYSLLEQLGPDQTINIAVDIVSKYPDFPSIQIPEYYNIRIKSADAVRQHVATALPKDTIDIILGDNLMLTTLLESLGDQKTITWATAISKLVYR